MIFSGFLLTVQKGFKPFLIMQCWTFIFLEPILDRDKNSVIKSATCFLTTLFVKDKKLKFNYCLKDLNLKSLLVSQILKNQIYQLALNQNFVTGLATVIFLERLKSAVLLQSHLWFRKVLTIFHSKKDFVISRFISSVSHSCLRPRKRFCCRASSHWAQSKTILSLTTKAICFNSPYRATNF